MPRGARAPRRNKFNNEVLYHTEEDAKKATRPRWWQNLANELYSNREVMIKAYDANWGTLKNECAGLRGDRDFILEALRFAVWRYDRYCAPDYEDNGNASMTLSDAKQNVEFLLTYAPQHKGDRELIMLAVGVELEGGKSALQFASETLRGDRQIVEKAVQNDDRALKYASDDLRGDREIVLLAVGRRGCNLEYASDDLRGDRDVVLVAITQDYRSFEYASDDLRSEPDFVLQAMVQNVEVDALRYSYGLSSNPDFMVQAMQLKEGAIEYVDKGLWNDRDFVLQAVGVRSSAFKHANDTMKGDRQFVEKAVGVGGSALQYASETLRGDRQIVEKAVEQDGVSLEHAYVRLKADRDLIMKAVRTDPKSIKFASEELRGDFDFMVEACAAEPRCIDHLEEEHKEHIREESEAVVAIRRDLAQNSKHLDGECTFFFVSRETFLAQGTWPKFQDLQKENLLVEKSIRLADGVRGKYSKHILSISHCWETPDVPDPTDTQLKAVQQYLNDHPEIHLVWGDYCSMPQGHRTLREKMEFKRMLPRINLLYLSTSVVQLVDITYPCRFWTQFESWLAMQLCTPTGLRGAKDARNVRYKIICIHSAEEDYEGAKLQKMWRNATAQVAYKVLSAEDVRVTNLSDKEAQLPKIKLLDEAVVEAFKQPSELPDPVDEPNQEVLKVPDFPACMDTSLEAELTVDWKAESEKLMKENDSLEKKNESLDRDIASLRKKNAMLRESAAGMKNIAEQIKICFRDLDKNGDGAITRRELQNVLHRLCRPGQAPTKEEIDRCIEAEDKNESGVIEYEAFVDRLMKPGARVQAGRQGAALFDSEACS